MNFSALFSLKEKRYREITGALVCDCTVSQQQNQPCRLPVGVFPHVGSVWLLLKSVFPVISVMGAEVGRSSSTSQLARGLYAGQEYSSRVNQMLTK